MYIYLAIIAVILMCETNIENVSINCEPYIATILENIHNQKEKWEPTIINMGYNFLYCFSLCQIQYNKIKSIILPIVSPKIIVVYSDIKNYLKDRGFIVESTSKRVILIDNNGIEICELVTKHKNKKDDDFQEMLNTQLDYSSILLLDKNNDIGCTNCIFYQTFPESLNYEISEINFMAIELEHNNKNYAINLKTECYNYYIVNNSLNQHFFKYYIQNVLKTSINPEKFDYKVTIIDHDVNIITLLPHQHLILEKNSYKIYNEPNTSGSNHDSDESGDFVNF